MDNENVHRPEPPREPPVRENAGPANPYQAAQIEYEPQGADAGDSGMLRMVIPVGRSGWAIVAGYLGLISILVIPAPFAVLCGILAIRDIRAHPNRHGMGRAIFGIVCGTLVMVTLAAYTAIALWIAGQMK